MNNGNLSHSAISILSYAIKDLEQNGALLRETYNSYLAYQLSRLSAEYTGELNKPLLDVLEGVINGRKYTKLKAIAQFEEAIRSIAELADTLPLETPLVTPQATPATQQEPTGLITSTMERTLSGPSVGKRVLCSLVAFALYTGTVGGPVSAMASQQEPTGVAQKAVTISKETERQFRSYLKEYDRGVVQAVKAYRMNLGRYSCGMLEDDTPVVLLVANASISLYGKKDIEMFKFNKLGATDKTTGDLLMPHKDGWGVSGKGKTLSARYDYVARILSLEYTEGTVTQYRNYACLRTVY